MPGAGDRVQVRPGHAVVYDVESADVIRMIHVAGTLTFAPDRDTLLSMGLLKIQPGDDAREEGFDCDAHVPAADPNRPQAALEVGTPLQPIPAGIVVGAPEQEPSDHRTVQMDAGEVERLMAAAGIELGGVEFMVDDRDGKRNYYDINALSNFVADGPKVVGFDPFAKLADWLEAEATSVNDHRAGVRELTGVGR